MRRSTEHLSDAEAARVVAARHGVAGERPPKGFEDGGADARTVGTMHPR